MVGPGGLQLCCVGLKNRTQRNEGGNQNTEKISHLPSIRLCLHSSRKSRSETGDWRQVERTLYPLRRALPLVDIVRLADRTV
jgi:hypothetical protein